MEKRRCPGCMGLTEKAVCPVCGWRSEQGNAPHQLQPGTVLRGQYVIGKVLGQGGYGITYLGWDRELERKVAIKEFFPNAMVTRDTARGTEVQFFTANTGNQYNASLKRFLREAQALAKFSQVPEIVSIYSCFEENGTAYIIMEYIKGSNLVQYTRNAGGRLSLEETLRILRPIMAALDRVHRAGIIHRDISPDNIILEPMGGAKLLDFGAARAVENPDADKELTRSTEAIVKQGFAPPEQYRSRGSIGPWSDEYALCATIYYCLTGRIPPDAVSRSVGEEELDWSGIPGLTKGQRAALEKGMAVSAKKRYPSVGALSRALFPEKAKPQPKPAAGYRKWLFAAAGMLLAAVAAVLLIWGEKGKDDSALRQTEPVTTAEMEPETTVETEPVTTTGPITIPGAQLSWVTFAMVPGESLSGIHYSQHGNQPFWGQTEYLRREVRSISFHDSLEVLPVNSWAWDVSEGRDGSILAWMNSGKLHVAADGKIALNPNASWMFAGFPNLQTIDFGGCLDTSGVTDMSYMFYCSSSLTSVDVSGFDTANVTDMSNMFCNCRSLESVDVSSFDTAKVTDMAGLFSGCSGLAAVDVSGFDTANVTDMHHMFSGCSSLTTLDASGFDTARVTNMGAMFNECSSLTALDVSGFGTANVTNMSYMFNRCSSLKELNLSSFRSTRVTEMGNMFSGCSSISRLICPDVKIQEAFRNR